MRIENVCILLLLHRFNVCISYIIYMHTYAYMFLYIWAFIFIAILFIYILFYLIFILFIFISMYGHICMYTSCLSCCRHSTLLGLQQAKQLALNLIQTVSVHTVWHLLYFRFNISSLVSFEISETVYVHVSFQFVESSFQQLMLCTHCKRMHLFANLTFHFEFLKV